jgi:hypothetical protein
MNTMMMRHLFHLQPEAKRLFFFMKMILPQIYHKLDGYLLKLLIIIFLQREKLLPSVEMVQANLPPNFSQEFIDGNFKLFFLYLNRI